MNVRFADGEIRLRVSRAELDGLLLRQRLSLQVTLPRQRRFTTTIHVATSQWELASDPTGLWISVPRAALEEFAATLPTKTGLTHAFQLEGGDTLQLSLEVDIKKRRSASSLS